MNKSKRTLNSQLITARWNPANGKLIINTLNDKKRFTVKKSEIFDTLEQMIVMLDSNDNVDSYSLAINNKDSTCYYFAVSVKNFRFLTKSNFTF